MLHFFLFSDTIREILAFPKAIRWCFTPGLCTYLSHFSFRRAALNCLSCFHSIQPLDLDFWVAHCYRDRDLKVENDSVDAFTSSIVNVALSSVHPSLKYLFFVLYSTTLVHCWLEFMKAVMSLCRVNSNCVTRSYFFFPFSNLFYFPLIYIKKKKVCQHRESRFVCHLTRWLCETLSPCLRVREGPLTWLIRTTCERWSFVYHRAAPPLHHKDHISFKDVHVYTSSPVVHIPCAVPFRDCNSNHLSSPPFYFYMLTARSHTVAALTRRFSSLIWEAIL